MSLSAGGVAELNILKFFSSLKNIRFVTEGIGKNNLASLVNKLCGSGVAGIVLSDVGLNENLIVGKIQLFLYAFKCLDEVVVIGGVFVVKADKTDFEICSLSVILVVSGCLAAAGSEGRYHNDCKKQC